MNTTKTYDHIVVGAGSAGCIVAARLAARGLRVLLLEAGPPDRSILLKVPGLGAFAAASPRFNWAYSSEPQSELDGRRLYLSQGRVLGGGSSINGMVYTRGLPSDYDAWRDAGCTGWGYDDILSWFRRSEDSERGEDAWHGVGGPLKVTRGRSSLPICDRILAATQEAGFARVEDFSRPGGADGFGYYDFTIAGGRRVSTAQAFLRGAGPTLTVASGAQVERIEIKAGRARGVTWRVGAERHTAMVTGEVVVCAGAVNSAKLLLLSGIGAAEDLRRLGVPVHLDQPQVGRNYQNHLCLKLLFATREPITGYRYLSPGPAVAAGARYLLGRGGFLSEGSSPVGGFFRSDEALAEPDLQLFAPPAAAGLVGAGLRALLPSRHGFALFVNEGRPASRGWIGLRSADPADAPVIEPRYLSEPADLEVLVRGVQRLREITAQPALASVISDEIGPAAEARTPAEIAQAIRRYATNFFHVAGTCRMGPEPAASVVDLRLRVHGVEGLRVADAGVMPTLVNGNLNAPVMMIAERAAAWVAEAP
jgi:choline dehydrogenase